MAIGLGDRNVGCPITRELYSIGEKRLSTFEAMGLDCAPKSADYLRGLICYVR